MMLKFLSVFVLIVVLHVSHKSSSGFILEDFWGLDIYGFLDYHEYPHEEHEVETEDGYLLTAVRITNGRYGFKEVENKFPVFLMHGLLCSAMDWVVLGPGKSLGLMLADLGYDVWLGNNRGNTLSRKHKHLDPDNDPTFWDYSYNEIGIFDLPAMIDTVLNKTNHKKLIYVGFSEGFTSFTVMGSERPEYMEKIVVMNAFAPVTDMHRITSPIFNTLATIPLRWTLDTNILHVNEILSHSTTLSTFLRFTCNSYNVQKYICAKIFYLAGFSKNQLDLNYMPTVLSNFPAGMSRKQLLHYLQGLKSGVFRKYDYNRDKNIEIYGSSNPPVYNLTKVTAPIILYYGEADNLVNNDILLNEVANQIPNVVEKYLVPYEKFNHLDFIWGQNISLLNSHAIENINKFKKLYTDESKNERF